MIFFRADGNAEVGAGHVMRCLSIVKEASKFEKIVFITADGSYSSVIQSMGINNHILHTNYTNLVEELEQMRDLIKKNYPSYLFVDSYFVTPTYLNVLWKLCSSVRCKLVYIDDVLEFAYPCDVLLNYNIYSLDRKKVYQQMYKDRGLPEPQLLLGTSYVPLRTEFQNLSERIVNEQVNDILISTGAADPEHICVKLGKEVIQGNYPYTFHFIIGSMNKDADEIRRLISDTHNIVLHQNVTDMADLMKNCDLAIAAAGSTLYELCATQTPALTYILADNQVPGANEFKRRGVLHCVGDYRIEPYFVRKLMDEVMNLADDYRRRLDTAKKMRTVVDGKGARRIVDTLLKIQ